MKNLDEISMNDAISLYYEKHHALRTGDLNKLRMLKNQCPDLFNPETDAEIRDLIDYAKQFQTSQRYKELLKLDFKKRFTIVKNDENPDEPPH